MSEVAVTREGTPESFGWLRRSEFDRPGSAVYEQPDGKLFAFPKGQGQRRPWLFVSEYDWRKFSE